MKLANEMLCREIGKLALQALEDTRTDHKAIVEVKALKALQKIKTIIENDSLSDFECVEQIVCVFEEIGSDGGNRHDFG